MGQTGGSPAHGTRAIWCQLPDGRVLLGGGRDVGGAAEWVPDWRWEAPTSAPVQAHLEHLLRVDHAVPHCKSRVTYKSALQGDEAHTVWVGDVVIRAAAIGTDTYELNRNLLLTPEARADSVPNLEIETGEIAGAGHASATGRFDAEQLFYLMARGIPEGTARRLVVRGFFADVVEQIGLPELQDRLMEAIEVELARVLPAPEVAGA